MNQFLECVGAFEMFWFDFVGGICALCWYHIESLRSIRIGCGNVFCVEGEKWSQKLKTLRFVECLGSPSSSFEFEMKLMNVQFANFNFDVHFRSRSSKFECRFDLWVRDFRKCFSAVHKFWFFLWLDWFWVQFLQGTFGFDASVFAVKVPLRQRTRFGFNSKRFLSWLSVTLHFPTKTSTLLSSFQPHFHFSL